MSIKNVLQIPSYEHLDFSELDTLVEEAIKQTSQNIISKALTYVILGQDYSRIDRAIDKSLAKLTISDLNNNTLNYSEMMKKYMTQNLDSSSITKELK